MFNRKDLAADAERKYEEVVRKLNMLETGYLLQNFEKLRGVNLVIRGRKYSWKQSCE